MVDRNVWSPYVAEEVVLLWVDGDLLLDCVIEGDPCVAPVEGQSQVEVHQTSSLVDVHDAPEVLDVIRQGNETYLRSQEAVIGRG